MREIDRDSLKRCIEAVQKKQMDIPYSLLVLAEAYLSGELVEVGKATGRVE